MFVPSHLPGENCEFIEGEAPAWEQVHGALQGLVVYINTKHAECSNDFMASCLLIGQQFLSYYENRYPNILYYLTFCTLFLVFYWTESRL